MEVGGQLHAPPPPPKQADPDTHYTEAEQSLDRPGSGAKTKTHLPISQLGIEIRSPSSWPRHYTASAAHL